MAPNTKARMGHHVRLAVNELKHAAWLLAEADDASLVDLRSDVEEVLRATEALEKMLRD
jgi:hypothetical protein